MTAGGPPSRQRWLYIAATAVLLLPLWAPPRVPTVDGACHLYNAWVMRHLHDPAYPLFATHFYVDPAPMPNWLIQGLLYVLLAVAPLAIAEKLLLTGYVVLFAASAWWFAGCQAPERRANAFLALPFVYNVLFHFGFYNFLYSLPLFLLAVGWWWRGRETPTWRWAAVLHGLLWLCYFAHIVSLVLAGLTIAVLWAVGFERAWWRRWLVQPLVLLPQLALPLWFVVRQDSGTAPSGWSLETKWLHLAELRPLFAFQPARAPGIALALLFGGLIAATLIGARRGADDDPNPQPLARHAFLVAALAATLLFVFGPAGVSGGGVLEPRLVLYPFLIVLPALAPGRRWLSLALPVALTLLVAWESAALTRWMQRTAGRIDALLAAHEPVVPNSRVVDILFDIYADLAHQADAHAIGYAAAEKGLIDWNDYQAATTVFPLRFRPGVAQPVHDALIPHEYKVVRYAPLVDYVYTRGMPPDSPLRARLLRKYVPVPTAGDGELWRRKGRSRPRPPRSSR